MPSEPSLRTPQSEEAPAVHRRGFIPAEHRATVLAAICAAVGAAIGAMTAGVADIWTGFIGADKEIRLEHFKLEREVVLNILDQDTAQRRKELLELLAKTGLVPTYETKMLAYLQELEEAGAEVPRYRRNVSQESSTGCSSTMKTVVLSSSGGIPEVNVMIGFLQQGIYTLTLYDEQGKAPVNIGSGNNVDSLPDVFSLNIEPNNLNGRLLGYAITISSPDNSNQQYSASIDVLQKGDIIDKSECSGSLENAKVIIGFLRFSVG